MIRRPERSTWGQAPLRPAAIAANACTRALSTGLRSVVAWAVAWAVGGVVIGACAGTAAPDDPGGCDTRVTGVVTVPNGQDPIPNATVFLPRDPAQGPPPFSSEIRCEPCAAAGNEVADVAAAVLSGPDGSFTLRGLPVGNLTLYVQKGRWRRSFPVTTTSCQETVLPRAAARLPRGQAEGELPQIAVAVGDFDAVECVLRHVGIDSAEFTSPIGQGKVHLYENEQLRKGGAPGGVGIERLLIDAKALARYQILMLNCTDIGGIEPFVRDAGIMNNLLGYVSAGGRLYATDWAYNFIAQQRQWSPYLCFDDGAPCGEATGRPLQGAALGFPGRFSASVPGADPLGPGSSAVKGLQKWLLQPQFGLPDGQVPISELLLNWVLMRDPQAGSQRPPTLTWLRGQTNGAERPLAATFDYPQPAACGRVLYSSPHTREHQLPGVPFPGYCPPDLIPQERVLEYLLFEVSTCVPGPA